MHIKRFREKNLKGALRAVKEAFGDEAVILSTREGRGEVEIVAAIDFDLEEIEKRFGSESIRKGLDELREELSGLKHLFSSIVKDSGLKEIAVLEKGSLELYEELLKNGLQEFLSQSLIKRAASLTEGERESLRDRCSRLIKEQAAIYNPLEGSEKPKLLAFLGPSGVGKTTTLVKLAGKLIQEEKMKIGIISLDNQRPGANETLKACGRMFGLSVATPETKQEFNKVAWAYKDTDLILIDTPGRNPQDKEGIIELRSFFNSGLPIRRGLVLSVTSRDDDLLNSCRGFGILPIDCLIFTKIDETHTFGSIMNTADFLKKPVAYLCNGQRIPEDISVASQELLGKLVLGRREENG